MSTPSDGSDNPWQQPGGPDPTSPPSNYGRPSSPSYGKYGQGEALPLPPAPAPPGPGAPGPQQAWGQSGYVAPQQQYAANQRTTLEPASGTMPAVIALSVLFGLGICLLGFLAPNQNQAIRDAYHAAENATAANPAPTPVLASGSGAYRLVSSLAILIEVAIWVVTAIWLTRVRQNAVVLRPAGQRRSETWVWLGWIIPIVNLWFPKQIVDDTIRATAEVSGQPRIGTGLWWTTWIVMSLLSGAQVGVSLLPVNHALHWAVLAVDAVVTIIGLLLWVRIVRWISSQQDALAARNR